MKVLNCILDIKEKLLNNEIIACNTDTVYGLLANADSPLAINKLYRIKKRSFKKKFVFFLNIESNLNKYIAKNQLTYMDKLKKLLNTGKVTCIFKSSEKYKKINDTIAIRIPNVKQISDLISISNFDIVCTSANISDNKNLKSKNEINKVFNNNVYFWSIYVKNSGCESTILDCSNGKNYKILREGCYSKKQINEFLI